jgi:8-hydroxy-5-deazaflavin:NADPH oxidoreductase
MKVTVIGAGGMGRGIATRLVGAHQVSVGSRDPDRAAGIAEELGAAGGGGYREVATDADVVFLTVPWVAVDETLAQLGDLHGTVLVDVTNPFVGGKLHLDPGSSGAERIQRMVPGARVVKGWNTIYEPVLRSVGDFGEQAPSVFLAGDGVAAKETVASLARDMDFDPVDCGPLVSARDLERLLSTFHAIGQGHERGRWALKVITR